MFLLPDKTEVGIKLMYKHSFEQKDDQHESDAPCPLSCDRNQTQTSQYNRSGPTASESRRTINN